MKQHAIVIACAIALLGAPAVLAQGKPAAEPAKPAAAPAKPAPAAKAEKPTAAAPAKPAAETKAEKPVAKAAAAEPKAVARRPSRAHEDARACLEHGSNAEIIKCAEQYL